MWGDSGHSGGEEETPGTYLTVNRHLQDPSLLETSPHASSTVVGEADSLFVY